MNHVNFLQLYVMLTAINNTIFVSIKGNYNIKYRTMNLFTKEKFEYLFQAVVIFLLFSPLYVPFSTKAKEDSNKKDFVGIKPIHFLKIVPTSEKKIKPTTFNYIFKPTVLPNELLTWGK